MVVMKNRKAIQEWECYGMKDFLDKLRLWPQFLKKYKKYGVSKESISEMYDNDVSEDEAIYDLLDDEKDIYELNWSSDEYSDESTFIIRKLEPLEIYKQGFIAGRMMR